jgi:hypothetical protein
VPAVHTIEAGKTSEGKDHYFRIGSKPEKLNASKCFPVFSRKRTSTRRTGTGFIPNPSLREQAVASIFPLAKRSARSALPLKADVPDDEGYVRFV